MDRSELNVYIFMVTFCDCHVNSRACKLLAKETDTSMALVRFFCKKWPKGFIIGFLRMQTFSKNNRRSLG